MMAHFLMDNLGLDRDRRQLCQQVFETMRAEILARQGSE
jgi:hypothetical protein